MHALPALSTLVMPTHTGSEAVQLILRWFHFIAGITWIGLLYFFNIVNVPFMKTVDAASNTLIALRADRQRCTIAFKGAGAGRFVETYSKCAVSSGNGTVTWTEQSGAIVVPSS